MKLVVIIQVWKILMIYEQLNMIVFWLFKMRSKYYACYITINIICKFSEDIIIKKIQLYADSYMTIYAWKVY